MRLVLAVSLLFATTASADLFDCGKKAPRKVSASAAGVTRVNVVGRAGSLRVTGRSGVGEVVATGTACATDTDDLQRIQLVSRRDGSELRIEAVVPDDGSWFRFNQGSLDFEVVLPIGMPVEVTDGSGSLEISDVGEVSVLDGSGELRIRSVRGNADIRDGSGSIDISDVTGNVEVNDGSGSMEIKNVGGSVLIGSDGSGGVEVDNVKGNLEVRRKGSGGVDYERIGGRVSVPDRHRD